MNGLTIFFCIVSTAAGAAIAYLLTERRSRSADRNLEAALAAAQQRCSDLSARLEQESAATETLRQQVSAADRSAAVLGAQLAAAQQNLTEQRKLLDDAHAQLKQAFASVSAEALAKNNEAF